MNIQSFFLLCLSAVLSACSSPHPQTAQTSSVRITAPQPDWQTSDRCANKICTEKPDQTASIYAPVPSEKRKQGLLGNGNCYGESAAKCYPKPPRNQP
ncbi:MAG: hypothetical protein Q4D82_05240 [Neisseria sp.]|nr:hypothetical protein [Neisseria sp.]